MSLQKKGIDTVQRGSGHSMGQPRKGNQFPRQVGMEPKVVRGDSLTPILPKGMDSGKMVDESTGGNPVSFRGMGIDAGI